MRAAACHCVRSLSRAVKSLRGGLIDAGLAPYILKVSTYFPILFLTVVQMLRDEDPLVQVFASSALCNLVLDFSAMKEYLIQSGYECNHNVM